MNRRAAAGVVFMALAMSGRGLDAADETGFVPLFDGKSLAGWKADATDRFTVRDGVIVNDGGTGWLRTLKPYKDFEFRAEYRVVAKGSDSGVLFRATAEGTPKPPNWPLKGYQLQIIDGDSNLMIFGHGAPSKFDRDSSALKGVMKGVGAWQAVALKVVGTRAEASLNGKTITTSDSIALPEGYLGLQGENGRFEWRALRIKEITSP
jgi:hypothetical protein